MEFILEICSEKINELNNFNNKFLGINLSKEIA